MSSHADEIDATKLKAAMISIFAFDTSWPSSKNVTNDSQINICVLGDPEMSKMGDVFREASKKYKRDYKLVPKHSITEINNSCHILFIGEAEKSHIEEKLEKLSNQSILTVSDIEGFADKGGMIEFSYIKQRVKVGVINHGAAKSANITIAAGLLEVALKVID